MNAPANPAQTGVLTIDGVKYDLQSLSKNARGALERLMATEAEVKRLEARLHMTRTAQRVYASELKAALPQSA